VSALKKGKLNSGVGHAAPYFQNHGSFSGAKIEHKETGHAWAF